MSQYAEVVADALHHHGVTSVGYVPSVTVAPIIKRLHEIAATDENSELNVFPLSREEEAMGILGGTAIGGNLSAAVMQDNGFGNALTAMTTFLQSYHVPLLIFANTRGGLGEYNSMIHSISQPMPNALRSFAFPVFELSYKDSISQWSDVVEEAVNHAQMTYRPVIVLGSFWNTDGKVA